MPVALIAECGAKSDAPPLDVSTCAETGSVSLAGRRETPFPLALNSYPLGLLNVTKARLSERLKLAGDG